MKRNDNRLAQELIDAFTRHAPRSGEIQQDAERYLVDGGSHTLRLTHPFPPRIRSAHGAWIQDEDGHRLLDFWQGHLGNILGHNPKVISSALANALNQQEGLQTGFPEGLQVRAAEILCRQTGSERVRFTTSGSLATMYATMLARAFTGRNMVVKVGGGWHGAQPWGLKGVGFSKGFQAVDSQGLPAGVTAEIIVTRFNDPDILSDQMKQYGDRVACLIVEPFMGAGGLIPASIEYLEAARNLTRDYGALLILDEVISGFRFRAGDAGTLYGVKPDLATFGKIIGGGMPVAAVGGRADVMEMVGRVRGCSVLFSGGTFSGHPASMLAAVTMMEYLVENEERVYPQLGQLGNRMRQILEKSFADEGILARCTGDGDGILSSSMAMVHFPFREDTPLDRPDTVLNPDYFDLELTSRIVPLALLLEGVYLLHSHGAASTAHTAHDLDFLANACRRVARRIRSSRGRQNPVMD